jgi:hypothetical protein
MSRSPTSLGPPLAAPPDRLGRVARRALALLAAAGLAAACGGGSSGGAGPAARPAPTGPAPAGGAGPAKGELATAEAVLEASIVAQGGRERMGKVKAMRQTGTFRIPEMGIKGVMIGVSAPPRSSLLTVELPGLGKISQGVSGDVAWELSPVTGARVITGDERTQTLREATFNSDLVWKELYPKVELAGTVTFAGVPAYKVVMAAPDGDSQTRYFAKDTLLPVGVEMVARSQMGNMPVAVEAADWREVAGVKYPHKLTRRQGPQTIEILVDKIEIDPQLDPATFALPPEIQALPPPGGKSPPPGGKSPPPGGKAPPPGGK